MKNCRFHFKRILTVIVDIDIYCETFDIHAGSCEVQIGSQTNLKSVTTGNSGNNVTAKANVTGIAYTVTKDGFLCPFGGTGAKTGATWTQNNAITLAPVSGGTDLTID